MNDAKPPVNVSEIIQVSECTIQAVNSLKLKIQ